MKQFSICILLVALAACAGNPPAWWNPSGTYDGKTPSATASSSKNITSVTTNRIAHTDLMPSEEDMEASFDDTFEEFNISPTDEMRQEQATASQAAESAQQPSATQEDTATKPTAPVKEHLPADGSLPVPSVLE